MQFQGALKNMGYDINVDGIWGNQTEGFYQDAINKRREGQGLLGYEYDKADAPISDGQGTPDGQNYETPLQDMGTNIQGGWGDFKEGISDWWDNSTVGNWFNK